MSVKFYINFKKSLRTVPNGSSFYENDILLKGTNGCVVILIHGLTGTPNEVRFIAMHLNKGGYTVFCPRLANHGEPLDILKDTKWQAFYQSARDAFLKFRGKGEKIFVGGLSMGALFSLLLADEFQGEVSGVCCMSPTLFYDGWNTPWTKGLLFVAYYTPLKHFFYFKEDPPYGIKNERIRQMVHRYYSKADIHDIKEVGRYGYPYFPVTLLCQLRLLVKYVSKRLSNVKAPVQLIQAEEDDMTSVKNSQFIYDRVSSEVKDYVLLHDSYHVITADQERELVAQKMQAFFDKVCYNLGK